MSSGALCPRMSEVKVNKSIETSSCYSGVCVGSCVYFYTEEPVCVLMYASVTCRYVNVPVYISCVHIIACVCL